MKVSMLKYVVGGLGEEMLKLFSSVVGIYDSGLEENVDVEGFRVRRRI